MTDVMWPDFRKNDLVEAILDYQQRERRYGLTSAQVPGRRQGIRNLKRVAILGSTGSVGEQTLEVIAAFPERFQVVGARRGSQASRSWPSRCGASGRRSSRSPSRTQRAR